MPVLTKIWTFDSNSDGFSLTNCSWSSGAILTSASGRNTTVSATSTISGTYESLGVPSGSTITNIQLKLDHRCGAYNVANRAYINANLNGALNIAQVDYAGVTEYATANGSIVSVSVASTSSFDILINTYSRTANNTSALVQVLFDNVQLVVTYDAPAPQIIISNYTKSKISDEVGHTTSTVTFSVDLAIAEWEARASTELQTPAHGVGLLVGDGLAVTANTDIDFDVDYTELTAGDRTYQITVYALVGGVWY